MEIHVELATQSKMFCGCKNGLGMEIEPNKNICPVCTGQPGTLPVPNRQAIDFVISAGLALNCDIARQSKFDRKNYFYPDLPKGYQISQFDQPLCGMGAIDIATTDEQGKPITKRIGITRIHLEEDTGKLTHAAGAKESFVDFNRAGVPLMELVTEPDITSADEAKKFCEELRMLFRYIGISPADMEKGQMRCEANISLHVEGADRLSGTKVELKNLNSFKAVQRGIEFEIQRQQEQLEHGETITQETRGWNEDKGESFSQRQKEEAHDYRYFPEPDILPLRFSDEDIAAIRAKLPELPSQKRVRFEKQFGLKAEVGSVIVGSKDLANYYENTATELENWMNEEGHAFSDEGKLKMYQLAANYLVTELQKHLFTSGEDIGNLKISPENFAELITIVYEGKINSSAAQLVLEEMFRTGADPSQVIDEKNLAQVSDSTSLTALVGEVLAEHEQSVVDYQNGKENALMFLIGQVMKKSQGKANPQVVRTLLEEQLIKQR